MDRDQQRRRPALRLSPTMRRRVAIVLYAAAAVFLALWIALAIARHRVYWPGLLTVFGMLLAATSVAVGGARKPLTRR